jgi:hypothetical protein
MVEHPSLQFKDLQVSNVSKSNPSQFKQSTNQYVRRTYRSQIPEDHCSSKSQSRSHTCSLQLLRYRRLRRKGSHRHELRQYCSSSSQTNRQYQTRHSLARKTLLRSLERSELLKVHNIRSAHEIWSHLRIEYGGVPDVLRTKAEPKFVVRNGLMTVSSDGTEGDGRVK